MIDTSQTFVSVGVSDNATRWLKLLSPSRLGLMADTPSMQDRSAFQQDYDRIVFCTAFRRLKDKTQVFPLAQSDYVRNRLTHSLEASCVGRSLGACVGRILTERYDLTDRLHASDFGAVVAAACLAHDIGNPPFGHAGEDAIREWCQNSGILDRLKLDNAQRTDFERYEGNAQGFRQLTRLQSPSNVGGLQLTAATLMAFSKYPRPSKIKPSLTGHSLKKFGYFQAESKFFEKSAFEVSLIDRGNGVYFRHPLAFLVEAADDICYRIVDLEDAVRIGVVPVKEAEELLVSVAGDSINTYRLNAIRDPQERIEYLRAKSIGRLVEEITEIFISHEEKIVQGKYDQALLNESKVVETLEEIEDISQQRIYTARSAMEIEAAGCEILAGLLELFSTAVEDSAQTGTGLRLPFWSRLRFRNDNVPSATYETISRLPIRSRVLMTLLPSQFLGENEQPNPDPYQRLLQIVDFVAGMTDSYAISLYRRLKGIELPA